MAERVRVRPEAIWLGRDRPGSFAMLHRPERASGGGVVICNTLGFEGLLAHRPFRHLAEALADQGLTVLRLDYKGTGDSFGASRNPTDVDGLLEGIDEGVDLLRSQEGCTAISLIGIRFGATLACRYALDHPVDSLVLWAPIASGPLYVRELKALNRLSVGSRPPQGLDTGPSADTTPGGLEVVGFEFARDLLAGMAEVDLVSEVSEASDVFGSSEHSRPSARRALVLDRDDTASSTDLVSALRTSGWVTDHQDIGGWSLFMVPDETQSEMPTDALKAIATWMSPPQSAASGVVTSLDLHRRQTHGRTGRMLGVASDRVVTERPVWIDDLFAIVTEPAAGLRSRRAVIVMANTGSVNRSGPGRLYVRLARRWAALGFTVVRVDLGGTGDSPAPAGGIENLPYLASHTAELLATVDWARANTDADDVSLFGICSGAYHSFQAAVQRCDVDRIVLVNPLILYLGTDDTTRTSRAKAVTAAHNMQRLGFLRSQLPAAMRSPRELVGFVRRAGRGLSYLWAARARRCFGRIGIAMREPEDLARDLDVLASRGITTLAVFAAGEPGARYLRAFGGATLARLVARGSAGVIDIDGGDHVFSPPAARQAMADAVTCHFETVRPALSLVGSVLKEG